MYMYGLELMLQATTSLDLRDQNRCCELLIEFQI